MANLNEMNETIDAAYMLNVLDDEGCALLQEVDTGTPETGAQAGKHPSCPLLTGARGAKVPCSWKTMITSTTYTIEIAKKILKRTSFQLVETF